MSSMEVRFINKLIRSRAGEFGATMIEAAVSFAVIMTVIFGTLSFTQTVFKKVQWHDYLLNMFSNAVIRYNDAAAIEGVLIDGNKYFCSGATAIPNCAQVDPPDCDPQVPQGCLAAVQVTKSDTMSLFKLKAIVRISSVGCSLLSGKDYIDVDVTQVKAGSN